MKKVYQKSTGVGFWRRYYVALLFLFLVSVGFSQPMNGTYTICPSGCNYSSVTAAASALTSRGVNGPVIFNVGAGTYSGQINLGVITGANTTNTITFDGGAGNASTRIITFAGTSNTNAHTIQLNGTSYINFRNLTIQNTGATAGSGFQLLSGASYVGIARCSVLVNTTATTTSFRCINVNNNSDVTSGSTCGGTTAAYNRITIDSNYLNGGHTSIFITSTISETGVAHSFWIRYNRMENIYAYGILTPNLRGYQINYNQIIMRGIFSGYGFGHCNGSTTGSQSYEFIGNTILNPGNMGIYYQTPNNNGARAKVINNFIGGTFLTTAARGIQLNYIRNVDCWHNTVVMDNAITTGNALYVGPANYPCDIQNNNLVLSNASATAAAMTVDPGCASALDYNNYYKAGNNNPLINVFGTNYSSLNFKGGQNLNQFSLAENPFLISGTDPRPRNPCFKGAVLGVSQDINFASRTTPPTIGCAEAVAGFNWDAKLEAIVSQNYPVTAGSQDVIIRIKNNGQNAITALNVTARVGSVTRTIAWTGNLATCATADVLFTGANQFVIQTGTNYLRAWVDSPNGNADENRSNDTLDKIACTSMPGGNYTINATLPAGNGNYQSFNAAVSEMACGGIAGPVTFTVAPGTYQEQVDIPEIPGASSANTITFDGVNRATRTLTAAGLVTGNYVFRLNGADFVRVRNLTIRNTSSTYGFVVHLTAKADSNIVENCNIHSVINVSSTNLIAVGIMGSTYTAGGDNGNYNIIRKNYIEGGYLGVVTYGTSTSVFCYNNIIEDNDINQSVYYGIYSYYQDGYRVRRNVIRNMISTGGYGMYSYYVRNFEYISNYARNANYMASYMSGCNVGGSMRSKVWNNVFGGSMTAGTGYGMYFTGCQNLDIYNNTSSVTCTAGAAMYITGGSSQALRNNIMARNQPGTYAMYAATTAVLSSSDYNLMYDYMSGGSLAYYGAAFTDLAAVKAAGLFEANSYYQEPNFVNAIAGQEDLHLTSTVMAPRGEYINGLTFDVDNETRCDIAPTIGADESRYFVIPPVASFAIPDTVYNGSPVNFLNTTQGDRRELKFYWMLDGTPAGTTFNVEQTFNNNTNYTMQLVARNCSASDTLTRTFAVVTPTSSPVSDFTADRFVVDMFETINLQDQSLYGPTTWTWSATPSSGAFFDNSSAKNPVASFFEAGYYELCLSTANTRGVGKDTCKKEYVLVRDLADMCNSFSSSAVAGRLADDGTLYGNYANNRNCNFLINPCAGSITLKFSSFVLADGGDFLRIYDGTNNQGVLLGTYSINSGLPGGANGITANSGKMFIEWVTNGTGVASGFDAAWSSTPDGTPKPVADFTFPAHIYTGKEVTFTSVSGGAGLTYRWDFDAPYGQPGLDGGFGSTDRYQWLAPGTYPVKLEVQNCGGTSSITKNIVVTDPVSTPLVGFTANRRRVPVQGEVILTDTSDQGPFAWTWEVNPSANVIFDNNDKTSPTARVYFFAPGLYEVKLIAENALGIDSAVRTQYIEVFEICRPGVGITNADIGISRVKMNYLDNSSAIGAAEYTSYVNNFIHERFVKGTSVNIQIERNTLIDDMSRKVWVDWNLDGDFNDSAELVLMEAAAKTKVFTGSFQVPMNASSGYSVLRIGTSYANGTNEPCGINPVGEFEDYPIWILNDDVRPVLTKTGVDTVYVEQWYAYVEPGFAATDNLDGNLTSQVLVQGTVDSSQVGTYTLNYEVSDLQGNISLPVRRTVIVTPDITPPVITLNGNSYELINVGTSYLDPGAVAMDYFNRNISGQMTVSGGVDVNQPGVYILSYSVTDGGNNTVSVDRTVEVADLDAPVITLNLPDTVTIEVGTAYTEPGYVITDNFDANVQVQVNPSAVNTSVTGTTLIRYSAADTRGNQATVRTRVLVVQDTQEPVIHLVGNDTVYVEVYGDYIEKGAVATDNYCVNASVVVSGYPDMTELGEYPVTYDVKDCEGNQAVTVTRVVKVVDRTSPLLSLNGFAKYTYHVRWATFNDPGVTITDNYYTETVLQPLVQITTAFSPAAVEGDYEYCYDLTDPSGNQANRVCRTIRVLENTTSVSELDGIQIAAFPNPTRDVLNITFNQTLDTEAKISVTDLTGRMIQTAVAPLGSEGTQLDLATQAAGMYLVKVELNGQVKLIKVTLSK